MKVYPFLSALIVLPLISYSQYDQTLTAFAKNDNDLISKEIKSYQLVHFDYQQFYKALTSQGEKARFELNFAEAESWELILESSKIVSPEALLVIRTEEGMRSENLDKVRTYRGQLKLPEVTDVSITVAPQFAKIAVRKGEDIVYLESAWRMDKSLPRDVYVYYNTKDVIPQEGTCGIGAHNVQKMTVKDHTESSELRATGGCFVNQLAILSDYEYYLDEGGDVGLVSAQIISILNDVQQEYSYDPGGDNFDDGVEFEISEIVISTCASCDPLSNSTAIEDILDEFTAWGPEGFENTHDLGVFWSGRDFDGTTIGLAWLSAVCSSFRYNVCENFATNADLLRVLMAHELGHNFGAQHDAGGAPFIMAPSAQITTTWSAFSQNSINANLPFFTCMANCGASPCELVTGIEISNVDGTGFNLDYDVTSADDYRITVFGVTENTDVFTLTTSQNSLRIEPSSWIECGSYEISVENDCGSSFSSPVKVLMSVNLDGCPEIFTEDNFTFETSPTVFFEGNQSEGALSYFWDFGDGNTSTSVNPSHSYASDGLYYATLEVNGNGLKDTAVIKILPNIVPPYQPMDGGSFDVNPWHFASDSDTEELLWESGIGSGPLSSNSVVWKTDLDGDVPDLTIQSYLISPEFDLSADGDYTLVFELAMESQFCNSPGALKMEFSTDLGTTWNTLGECADNDLSDVSNWYNKGISSSSGACSSCPISDLIFADSSGWLFNLSTPVVVEYPLTALQGLSSVVFRFNYAISSLFPSGFSDGAMVDNFEILFSPQGNPCAGIVLDLDTQDYPGQFFASDTINAVGLHDAGNVILSTQGIVNLLPQFEVQLGATLETTSDPCD